MQQPNGLQQVNYGWASWLLSAMAAVSLGWSVRDGLRGRTVVQKLQAG